MHPGRGRDIRGSLARFHRNLPFRPPFSPLFVGFSVRVLHHALWTTLWILDFRKQTLAKSGKKGSHSSAKPNGKVVQKVGSKQREPHARVRAEVDDVVRLVGNSPLRHVSPGPRKRGEVRRPPPPPRCEFAVGAAWLGVGFVRVTSSESDEDRGEEGRGSPSWSPFRGAQRAAAHTPLLTPPRALAAASWWSLANHWKHVRIYHNNKVTRRVTHTCSLLCPPQLAFFLFPPKSASFFTRLAFFRCGGCSVRTNTCHTRVLRLPLSLCFRAFRLQESSNFSLLLCSSSRQHRRNVFTSSSEAAQFDRPSF